MDKIHLFNDCLVEAYLNELKFRSLVTMEILLSIMQLFKKDNSMNFSLKCSTVDLFEASYIKHFMKKTIIDMLIESRIIHKNEVFEECRRNIPFELFDYNCFNEFFNELKLCCRQSHGYKLIEFKQ